MLFSSELKDEFFENRTGRSSFPHLTIVKKKSVLLGFYHLKLPKLEGVKNVSGRVGII